MAVSSRAAPKGQPFFALNAARRSLFVPQKQRRAGKGVAHCRLPQGFAISANGNPLRDFSFVCRLACAVNTNEKGSITAILCVHPNGKKSSISPKSIYWNNCVKEIRGFECWPKDFLPDILYKLPWERWFIMIGVFISLHILNLRLF